jgi:hypothetical protein
VTGIRDEGLPLPQPRRVMTSREIAQWGVLALDEQYQAPGECGSADGRAEHAVIVQLRDMPRCQQRWAAIFKSMSRRMGTLPSFQRI